MQEDIGLYNPLIIFVGCSRVVYWIDDLEELVRVEKLICNYGPLINNLSLTLPLEYCKRRSIEYPYLCREYNF